MAKPGRVWTSGFGVRDAEGDLVEVGPAGGLIFETLTDVMQRPGKLWPLHADTLAPALGANPIGTTPPNVRSANIKHENRDTREREMGVVMAWRLDRFSQRLRSCWGAFLNSPRMLPIRCVPPGAVGLQLTALLSTSLWR